MNKQNLFSSVLAVAVVALFILHFTNNGTPTDSADDQVEMEDTIPQEAEVPQVDTAAQAASKASSIAFFNARALVEKCPKLNAKQKMLQQRSDRLLSKRDQKMREYEMWTVSKQKELQEYQRKGMLVPAHEEKAMQEGYAMQQAIAAELQQDEEALVKLKNSVLTEQTEAIEKAVETLNAVQQWDYILVDTEELRVVIPFNEDNDLTEDLAKIINGK